MELEWIELIEAFEVTARLVVLRVPAIVAFELTIKLLTTNGSVTTSVAREISATSEFLSLPNIGSK